MSLLFIDIIQSKFPFKYVDGDFYNALISDCLTAFLAPPTVDKLVAKEKKYYRDRNNELLAGKLNISEFKIFESNLEQFYHIFESLLLEYMPSSINKYKLDIITIPTEIEPETILLLPFKRFPGLYLKQGIIPIVYREDELIPFSKADINPEVYFKSCFDSGIFKEEASIEEIKDRYAKLDFNDDDGLDKFLYCAERLLKLNIILVSNRFVGVEDNDNRYFLLSSIDNRHIDERLPFYFIYRHINVDTNETMYYKIDFLDINNKQILEDFVDFSKQRLVRKYKENYELSELKKVEWEPSDIERDLPVIEINIDGKSVSLMVGSTYNLYTVTDKKLVGKLDIVSVEGENGVANIQWIEKYPAKLI